MKRVLAMAFVLLFCLGAEECRFEDDLGEERILDFETLNNVDGSRAQGDTSGIGSAQLVVIRDEDSFAELWERHAAGFTNPPARPDVEFGERMLIAAFAGTRPTTGYSITVEEIRENDEFINVDVETRTPGNGCDVAERETQPFHIVVLDDSDAPVNFNQSTVKGSAC